MNSIIFLFSSLFLQNIPAAEIKSAPYSSYDAVSNGTAAAAEETGDGDDFASGNDAGGNGGPVIEEAEISSETVQNDRVDAYLENLSETNDKKKAYPVDGRPISQLAGAELAFIKKASENHSDDELAPLLLTTDFWLRAYAGAEGADEAELIKAKLYASAGDSRRAAVTLFGLLAEYESSNCRKEAGRMLADIINRRFRKKLRGPLNDVLKDIEGGTPAVRLASVYGILADKFPDEFAESLSEEYIDFISRFPDYAGRDGVMYRLAGLYSQRREYKEAIMMYREILSVYPAGPAVGKAKLALAGVYTYGTKEFPEAVNVYDEITREFPGTPEAWVAYTELPRLAERLKRFTFAVSVYQKIFSLYPDKPEAKYALRALARVYLEELKDPKKASETLLLYEKTWRDGGGLEALYNAAGIAKDSGDFEGEMALFTKIGSDYPEEEPRAMLLAVTACGAKKDKEKASELLEKLSAKYPDSPEAAKAKKIVDALAGK